MGLGAPAVATNQKKEGAGAGGSHTALSVTGDGSLATPIKLVNDAAAPGNGKYYGTSYAGAKGYVDPDIPVFNVIKGGGDPTGAVDVGPTIAAALAAGYRSIYFPAGTYTQTTAVVLPDNTSVYGAGRHQAVISTTSDISLYTCGFECSFYALGFRGDNPAPHVNQHAITINQVYGTSVHDCWFDFFADAAIYATNTALLPGTQAYYSNFITSNLFTTCVVGVTLDVRAEYFLITGNSMNDGSRGIIVTGGNNGLFGNNLSGLGIGIDLRAGANNGHGVAMGNVINHCAVTITATGVSFGFTFIGNMMYYGAITIVNCDHFAFTGGDCDGLGANPITITNSTNVYFNGVHFISAPVWVITGVAPTVVSYDAVARSWSLIDPVNAKQLDIAQINGVTSFTGSGNVAYLFNSLVSNGRTVQIAGNMSLGTDFTLNIDFPNTLAFSSSDAVTGLALGALVGDFVQLGIDPASVMPNSCFTAWVSAPDTVTVRFNNYSAVAQNPPVGSFKISVIKAA